MGRQRWMTAGFVCGCVFMAALLVRCGGATPIAKMLDGGMKMLDGGLAMLMPDSGTSAMQDAGPSPMQDAGSSLIQDAGASPMQDAGTSLSGLSVTTMTASCSRVGAGQVMFADFSIPGLDALHPPVMQAWICDDAAGECYTTVVSTKGTTVSVVCTSQNYNRAILQIIH